MPFFGRLAIRFYPLGHVARRTFLQSGKLQIAPRTVCPDLLLNQAPLLKLPFDKLLPLGLIALMSLFHFQFIVSLESRMPASYTIPQTPQTATETFGAHPALLRPSLGLLLPKHPPFATLTRNKIALPVHKIHTRAIEF